MSKNKLAKIITLLLGALLAFFLFLSCTADHNGTSSSEKPEETQGDNDMKDIVVEPSDVEIGIWYSVWYTYDPEDPGNKEKNLWLDWDIRYKPLLPDGTYGLYDSMDEELINFHLK